MSKHLDRDDELPEFLDQIDDDEAERIVASLPDGVPDLGKLETVMRPPFSFGYSPWAWLLVAALQLPWVVVIPLGLKAEAAQVGVDETGWRIGRIMAIVFGVGGTASLLFALFLFRLPWFRRGENWLFFREGVVRTRWGGNPVVFPWKGFAATKVAASGHRHTFEFTAPGVKPVRMSLGPVMPRTLVRSLLDRHILARGPSLLRAIDAGRSVSFGPFDVAQDGLGYEGKPIAWDAISRIEATSDERWQPHLEVYSGRKKCWADVNVAEEVPNTWLMMWLIRKLAPHTVKDFEALQQILA